VTGVHREVKQSYPDESAQAIARLDPDTLRELGLEPGDIVALEGGDTTPVTVGRANRRDWDADTIRIGEYTRKNADVALDEPVTIRDVEAVPLDQIVLTPTEEASLQFESDAADLVKRQLLKRPVVEGDVVPVGSSPHHPDMRSPGQAIKLVAVDADPAGIGRITDGTEVVLKEDYTSTDDESGADGCPEDTADSNEHPDNSEEQSVPANSERSQQAEQLVAHFIEHLSDLGFELRPDTNPRQPTAFAAEASDGRLTWRVLVVSGDRPPEREALDAVAWIRLGAGASAQDPPSVRWGLAVPYGRQERFIRVRDTLAKHFTHQMLVSLRVHLVYAVEEGGIVVVPPEKI
jgi:hypothetical protein